jgi:hypothetical protein
MAEDIFIHMGAPKPACKHEFNGWREFEDGCGGEQVCKHCGIGAMEWSMRYLP